MKLDTEPAKASTTKSKKERMAYSVSQTNKTSQNIKFNSGFDKSASV